MTRKILLLLVLLVLVAAAYGFLLPSPVRKFTAELKRAKDVVVWEGLPHQTHEPMLLAQELASKPNRQLHGYPFYLATLTLSDDDLHEVTELLSREATYIRFRSGKKCGGFHPDYAVEFLVDGQPFMVQICFGCQEAKLFGPKIESRHDLESKAYFALQKRLNANRKSRPTNKEIESGEVE